MTLCAFKGQESPCIAQAKPDSPRQFCGPHEQMLQHDYALAFLRRTAKHGTGNAEQWAHARGLDVGKLKAAASELRDTTRPLTVKTVADVDAL